jgi:hypothetical protein
MGEIAVTPGGTGHSGPLGPPLTIEPVSATVFSGGAVAHVFAAHPCPSPIGNQERTL